MIPITSIPAFSIWAFEYFANLAREVKGEVIPLGDINFRDFDCCYI